MPSGKPIRRIGIKKFIIGAVRNSKVLVATAISKIDLQGL